jgi:hypothetical protein
MKILTILPFLLIATFVCGQELPSGYTLIYDQNFDEENATNDFRFTQPEKWISAEGKTGKALEFTGISEYQPPHRSPHTIGIIRSVAAGSFILEADLLQTGKEYGHRDMCVIFGFNDPAHFYYAHVATAMDDNAHQIMVVNNAPRTKISSFTTKGVDWGNQQWHKVRVERDISSGSIKIFFDGTLIQEAKDKSFGKGYIGFGSFDDSGKIDNIRIWAKDYEKKPIEVFTAKTGR